MSNGLRTGRRTKVVQQHECRSPSLPSFSLGNEEALQRQVGSLYAWLQPCDKFVMRVADLVTSDPDLLGGTTVFEGTRVPVRTLFDYLENNYSLDEFLECFPSVSREAARGLLELSQAAVLTAAA